MSLMHIDDLRNFAMLWWLHKTEDVCADKAHYATNIAGDIMNLGGLVRSMVIHSVQQRGTRHNVIGLA
jgi:hypothetical protein